MTPIRESLGLGAVLAFLLLLTAPAQAQSGCDGLLQLAQNNCADFAQSMTERMTRVTSNIQEGQKRAHDFGQRFDQWRRDYRYFTNGGTTDAAMMDQLQGDWQFLRREAGELLTLMNATFQAMSLACGDAGVMSQCLGDPAATQANCSTAMASLEGGIKHYTSLRERFARDWRANTRGLAVAQSVEGRVLVNRGMRSFMLTAGGAVLTGDQIRPEAGSFVVLQVPGRGVVRISTAIDMAPEPPALGVIEETFHTTIKDITDLLQGEKFEIKTPTATAGVRG